jgi:hypothetical protein
LSSWSSTFVSGLRRVMATPSAAAGSAEANEDAHWPPARSWERCRQGRRPPIAEGRSALVVPLEVERSRDWPSILPEQSGRINASDGQFPEPGGFEATRARR